MTKPGHSTCQDSLKPAIQRDYGAMNIVRLDFSTTMVTQIVPLQPDWESPER